MKNSIIYRSITSLFFVLCLPFFTMGHGYWLEVQGSGKANEAVKIQIYFGEFENQKRETGKLLDRMSEIMISVIDQDGITTSVPMVQTNTCWEGTFIPSKDGVYQILGINDSREVQDWNKHGLGIVRPIQFLRTTYIVGGKTAGEQAKNFLDLVANQSEKSILLAAYKDNQSFSKTSVTIINPEGWKKEKVTNDNGKTTFIPSMKGLYLIELEWTDKTPGTFKGKEYQTVRYRCETTIKVE